MEQKDGLLGGAVLFVALSAADWIIQATLTDAVNGGAGVTRFASELSRSGFLIGVAVGLVGAWLFLSRKDIWALFRPARLLEHYNESFPKTTVLLDGNAFYNCTFTDTTFRWNGGAFLISQCQVGVPWVLETQNNTALETIELLRALNALETTFAANWRRLPAKHFNPSTRP